MQLWMCVLTLPGFLPSSLCSGLTVCLLFCVAYNLCIAIRVSCSESALWFLALVHFAEGISVLSPEQTLKKLFFLLSQLLPFYMNEWWLAEHPLPSLFALPLPLPESWPCFEESFSKPDFLPSLCAIDIPGTIHLLPPIPTLSSSPLV